MSNVQIPNLPAATGISGSEQFESVQNGTSVRVTASQIGAYINSTYPAPGISSVSGTTPIAASTVGNAVTISLNSQGITNTFMAPMPAGTVKANVTVGSASPTDATVSQVLDVLGSGGGSVLYRGAVSWAALAAGSPNQVLTSGGTGAPSWQTLSVPSGQIAPTGVTAGTYGSASQVPRFTVLASGQISSVTNTSIAISAGAVSGLAPSATIDTTIADNITFGQLSAARYSTTLSAAIDSAFGNSQGDILYRGASGWTVLPASTSGRVLATGGTGANPSWVPAGGTGTVTSVATGTGLTGGPITTTGTISLANTAVSAGAYGSQSSVGTFTVNAQGQLTAAASVPINAVALTTGTISTAPTNATDIANKDYVDSVAQGLNFHAACNYATTADLGTVTYNNGSSGVGATITKTAPFSTLAIDGHTFTSGDVGLRVLVKNESNAAYNGIYTVTSIGSGSVGWVLTRATDYDSSGTGTNEIDAGDFVLVLSGSTLANTSWVQQTPLPIVVGTTNITFTQFGAPVLYSAGTGLTLAGNTFSITNTAVTAGSYGSGSTVGTFTVNAQGQLTAAASTAIAINANQITAGTVTVAQGGTGATTLTGYVKGSGTSALTASATIPNTDISGLGTMSTQNASSVAITGGSINGTPIGGTTPASGAFTTLGATGNTSLATVIAGTWNGSAVGVAYGGTGLTSTPTNGQILIGNGTGYALSTITGSTGLNVSNGAGAITLTNTGVTSAVAGTGISVSSATGAVTFTNTGVTSLIAGSNITISGSTGAITISSTNPGGTVTSVNASGGTTGLTFSGGPITGSGTLTLAGTLGVANGGTGTTTAFTTGSVVFAGASGTYSQNNSKVFWDNTNFRLGIGTATPAVSLAVSATDAVLLPVGTTGQQPTGAAGMLRFNTTTTSFEGYNGSAWGSIGGGATGGGTDQIFYLNGQTVTTNYTIPTGQNAGTFGPISVNSGVVVTIPSGSTWTVV